MMDFWTTLPAPTCSFFISSIPPPRTKQSIMVNAPAGKNLWVAASDGDLERVQVSMSMSMSMSMRARAHGSELELERYG
jgi:hypothetical protein